jgi:hypothetical protein
MVYMVTTGLYMVIEQVKEVRKLNKETNERIRE